MFTMTHEQAMEFLAVGVRTGKVATASPDGKVHVAPLWFVVDGQDLVFTRPRRASRAATCTRTRGPPSAWTMTPTRAPS
jgi:hypothetical protein